ACFSFRSVDGIDVRNGFAQGAWNFDECMPGCLVTRIARRGGALEGRSERVAVPRVCRSFQFGGMRFSKGICERWHRREVSFSRNLSARKIVREDFFNLAHLERGELESSGGSRATSELESACDVHHKRTIAKLRLRRALLRARDDAGECNPRHSHGI